MEKIYRYININEFNIDEMQKSVSAKRIERSEKYKFEVDKKRSIAVEYLLNQMIDEFHSEIKTPVELTYDQSGKPHIYSNSMEDVIQISLSHSGDYVACMISDVECGIDIEKHSKKREYEKIATRICTERELSNIHDAKDFYDIWTLKESAIKAVGLGLSMDMKKCEMIKIERGIFEIEISGHKYKGEILDSPEDYSCSIVYKNES